MPPSASALFGPRTRFGLYSDCSPAWPRAQSLPALTGCAGLPSSLMARASRVLTWSPQPAAHSVQVLA